MSTAFPCPGFYKAVFLFLDPMFTTLGAVSALFNPGFLLQGYSPTFKLPMATETQILMDQAGGMFAMLWMLQMGLWWRRGDKGSWRLLQSATLVLDIVTFYALLRGLNNQGSLDPRDWRSLDYQNILGNGLIGLVRLAFVLNLGMGKGRKGKTA